MFNTSSAIDCDCLHGCLRPFRTWTRRLGEKGLDLSILQGIGRSNQSSVASRSAALFGDIHADEATRLWGRDGGKKLGCRHHRSRFHPIDHIRNYSRATISNLFLIGLCMRIEFVLSLYVTATSVVVRFIFSGSNPSLDASTMRLCGRWSPVAYWPRTKKGKNMSEGVQKEW